jgi:hypothetical protein
MYTALVNATSFFPAWSHRLNPMGSRTAKLLRGAGALTLCQLETCFAAWTPPQLFPKATAKQNSRDRDYTPVRTFWCMLWQSFNPLAPGREVVRQLQALFELENRRPLSPEDGAYCRAKSRLPLDQFPTVLKATAGSADQLSHQTPQFLQSRWVKVVDGSTVTLQDTPKNRKAFPAVTCGTFPIMRFVAFFSLLSGAIIGVAQGAWGISELGLMHSLAAQLGAGDILVADRGFGSYPVVAWLQLAGIDFIGRTTRRIDGRRGVKRLGRNDWMIRWKESLSCSSPWLSHSERSALPAEMLIRAVKGSCFRKGFRVRQLTVITTLLDPELYPAEEILLAYLRRWRMEMCLDDLKTTLQMESLRGRTPEMARREMYTRLIAHNLIRCTMAQAAVKHSVVLERLSFKGSLDALRQFTQAMTMARSKAKRRQLWELLLDTLAKDRVPARPGRREPRAVKRRKSKYQRLHGSRHHFKDRPGRHKRERSARLRRLAAM